MELSYADYCFEGPVLRQRLLVPTRVYGTRYCDDRYGAIDGQVRVLARKRLEVLEAFVSRGTLLDFGCGTNRFAQLARRRGWDARGFDLVEGPGPRAELEKMVGSSAVTFFDSLEHVVDPRALIRYLRPGAIMISVPECHFPDNKAWFMGWKHRRPGEHLWHWNARSLATFMRELDYRELMQSHFEDAYRAPYDSALPNIVTAIYVRP